MSKKYLVTQDQTVDGMPLEDSAVIHYTTCSTAAATVAKTAALSGFKIGTGAWVAVKFTVTNTAANPTLNINGTGAKAIRYRNAAVSAGVLAANRIYLMVYDGTYWQIVGDLDTVYSHPTSAGNKHIPSGGTNNAILTYSGTSGEATWSTMCKATAIEVVCGTKNMPEATVAYKAGRTKALVMGWVMNESTDLSTYAVYQAHLFTGLSSSMTAQSYTGNNFTSTSNFTVKISAAGVITISGGFAGGYTVIWFN